MVPIAWAAAGALMTVLSVVGLTNLVWMALLALLFLVD
jgi:predicted metal-binding membrane protein